MTPNQMRYEIWRLYLAACRSHGLAPMPRREFDQAMANETAPYTAADGTIDGADLRAAVNIVLRRRTNRI